MIEEIKGLFRKISDRVFGKKEQSLETPVEWLSEEDRKILEKLKKEQVKVITLPKLKIPKIRFATNFTWLKGKRFLAGLLLCFDVLAFITSFSSLESIVIGVFFILHSLILLDYLYKTKRRVMRQKEMVVTAS